MSAWKQEQMERAMEDNALLISGLGADLLESLENKDFVEAEQLLEQVEEAVTEFRESLRVRLAL